MRSKHLSRALLALGCAVLTTVACTVQAVAHDASPDSPRPGNPSVRPFEPIHHDYLPLPGGVMPWAPTWTPDGQILFHDYNGGREWLADADGTDVECVTCGHQDRPSIIGAFTYAFPDGRRMLIANELGDNVTVLECAPSLRDCAEHAYRPVDFSADDATAQGKPGFGRRTFHLAPDGVHLGYNFQRRDSLIMIVARLERTADGYAAVSPRVINPPSATSLDDQRASAWAAGSQLYEFKSFAEGGRSAIIVGEPDGMNADMLEVDLVTGRSTRLTGNADWDEDGGPSPDGDHLVVGSWRGMHRVDPVGVFPYEPFFAYPGFAAIAGYYVSSRAGFQCDIQPWLLGGEGDHDGALMGQPLAPYRGGNDIIGNNITGNTQWSPDSTRVLIQERQLGGVPAGSNDYVRQKGTSPSRLMVARLERTPAKPVRTVTTTVGRWALSPQDYTGAYGIPGTHVVRGKRGTVAVDRHGSPGGIVGSAVYRDYSRDGKVFISGTETISGAATSGTLDYTVQLTARDRAGRKIGFVDVDYTFDHLAVNPQPDAPGTTMTGHAEAEFRGERAGGIAQAAPCPEQFPRPSRLDVGAAAVKGGGPFGAVRVTVTADVDGDRRPVRRARVDVLGRQVVTNDAGVATVVVPRSAAGRHVTVTATAGDTFDPGTAEVRLPR